MQHKLATLLVIASSFAPPAFFQPLYAAEKAIPLTRAVILSNNCFTCHSDNSTNNNVSTASDIPSISSFKKNALATRLLAFKQGQIPSTVMGRLAKGYTDDDLRLIADYLGQ